MARKNDDILMEDDLAAAFLGGLDGFDTELTPETELAPEEPEPVEELPEEEPEQPEEEYPDDDDWEESAEDFPGQLAVDVYETADKLIVKARTAGINKEDLDVSISDNILTISGTLNGDEEEQVAQWHIQECYWGRFSRTIVLPVAVREDEDSVVAKLEEGVLTITFIKEAIQETKKIKVL